jgi:amino acid transporter
VTAVADARSTAEAEPARISLVLFVGLTVAATGGPLALAALYVPSVLGDAQRSAGLVAVLGAVLFIPAMLVWLRYSESVVTDGGLYAFVEAAAGRRVAAVQAGLWVLSYGLYLVYTIAYLAYDLLPAMFPSVSGHSALLQLVIPLAIAAVVLLPVRRSLAVITAAALAQLVLVGALAVVAVGHLGSPGSSFL